jgi:4-hydroxy-2-oxoheptanedioate aldolase
MIETAEALADLDAILAVDGIDGVFVGPYDLSIALGVTLEELLAASAPDAPLRRIAAACAAAGVRAGAFAGTPARGAQLAALGFTNLAIATDTGILDVGAASMLPGDSAARQGY